MVITKTKFLTQAVLWTNLPLIYLKKHDLLSSVTSPFLSKTNSV